MKVTPIEVNLELGTVELYYLPANPEKWQFSNVCWIYRISVFAASAYQDFLQSLMERLQLEYACPIIILISIEGEMAALACFLEKVGFTKIPMNYSNDESEQYIYAHGNLDMVSFTSVMETIADIEA